MTTWKRLAIKSETYSKLIRLRGTLEQKYGKKVSLNDVIEALLYVAPEIEIKLK